MTTTKKPTAVNRVQWALGEESGRAARHNNNCIKVDKLQHLPVPATELCALLKVYRRELLSCREDSHVQHLLNAVLLILNEEGRP